MLKGTGRRRRDARENREAILDAARDLFADSADVAMCQIARRAGVGQATLYRNFPSRGALVAELLDEHVGRIAALAAKQSGESDAFFVLLSRLIDGMVDLHGVAVLAGKDAETGSQIKRGRQRIAGILKGPLRDAKAAGTLRRDLTVEDVFLLLAMSRGAMEGLVDSPSRSAATRRVLALILSGIEGNSPRRGSSTPIFTPEHW